MEKASSGIATGALYAIGIAGARPAKTAEAGEIKLLRALRLVERMAQ